MLQDRESLTATIGQLQIRPFSEEDADAVVALWERCGLTRGWNDPRRDIARKLAVQRELFLVALSGERLVATVMAGYEGHRGWVNYLAVDHAWRGRGLGREMMAVVERELTARGCPKVALLIRRDNVRAAGFYCHLGYAEDDVISMGKRLEADEA
jgi:ribosomal protein S18 acetylase RimI-like enzyme